MARLIYMANVSLDGYVADANGNLDWSAPDDEVHAFINDLLRPVGTHLYGRRMYETMVVWETMDTGAAQPAVVRDFARIWRAVDKIVYSSTLETVASARTRLERRFDPEAVRRLKARAERDLIVGGAELASQAVRAGLVDEIRLSIVPTLVGGGKPAFLEAGRLTLDLLDERRFANGVVHLHYRVGT